MGNDGDNGRVHRTILVEGVHSAVRGENESHNSHYCFRLENIHRSKAKPLLGAVDEMTENVRSRKRNARARSVHRVPRDAVTPMAVHTAHGDCQSCFRARRTHCKLHFHNVVEMDHCSDLDAVDVLRNAMRWESTGEASCEKLVTSSGVPNRMRIRPQQVDAVCPEWDTPKNRCCLPCFVELPSTVLLVSSCHIL